ncbi:hypothetical protein F5B19DRAFT_494476 [Rostrohypoxylon terebratum]|nr:hypothetical protein F5B19DRAFT_494476 [Rostrohypoxylon terebratum]
MAIWGRGLMQSEDDYEIARDLEIMCGCKLIFSKKDEDKKVDSVQILNGGMFSKLFEKILTASFRPLTSYHKRERIAIIFATLSMELSVKIDDRFLTALHVLRPWLPNIEQQLQLFTALNEYKNDGTPWVSGSKNLEDTLETSGDELWYSGLGHSADEEPKSEMSSNACLSCRDFESNLFRCTRCKMARYCSKDCQRYDWMVHKRVCEFRDIPRVCHIKEEISMAATNAAKMQDAPHPEPLLTSP